MFVPNLLKQSNERVIKIEGSNRTPAYHGTERHEVITHYLISLIKDDMKN